MAFWFVSEKPDSDAIFGGPNRWNGLAVILDSFDNDRKANNPLIAAFVNNGSYAYNEQSDGEHQISAGCISDYRNKPFPVYLKVTYHRHILLLQISDGMSAKPIYHQCGVKENVNLPAAGYFGLSASTGDDNPDDHDCYSFVVHTIVPREHAVTHDSIQRKQLEEYLKKAREVQTAQREYARQHPDKVKHRTAPDEAMPLGSDHDMKLVYEMHSEIRDAVNSIFSKLNEVIGRLETSTSMISKLSGSDINAANNVQGNQNELQRILQSQVEVVNSNRRLLQDVNAVMMQIQQLNQGQTDDSWKQNLIEKMSVLVNRKPIPRGGQHSTKLLWLVIILQSLTLIGAVVLLGRAEQSVKKFY
ncbi:hypothetical protein GJ496_005733 [Pomphorhynchus laevis]|nr:hypothetical protein GJ496_005733 [Pomphorhynchus laevis]